MSNALGFVFFLVAMFVIIYLMLFLVTKNSEYINKEVDEIKIQF